MKVNADDRVLGIYFHLTQYTAHAAHCGGAGWIELARIACLKGLYNGQPRPSTQQETQILRCSRKAQTIPKQNVPIGYIKYV